ncbi:YwiC-like protein [Corynebacterium uterequi]|uniref:YwiC-like protein n=2 Tax=Corynebacterium uterequi TaxID=1072256 RepID=A0A0G3HE22_9CORY|nr:YwiC-like protein [Corynebacterium uterequi]
MLITPAIVGLVAAVVHGTTAQQGAGHWLAVVAVLLAWFLGYGSFFAFGLAVKARTWERRRPYLTPCVCYGVPAAVLVGLVALVDAPWLLSWAVTYAPLLAIAAIETLRRRPRSTVSGVATTMAAALLVAAMVDLVGGPKAEGLAASAVLALYFTGSVPLVKSVIRQRGNDAYFAGSVAYHVLAVGALICLWVCARPSSVGMALGLGVLVAEAAYAVYFPLAQRRGAPVTAKKVGLALAPLGVAAGVASLIIAV